MNLNRPSISWVWFTPPWQRQELPWSLRLCQKANFMQHLRRGSELANTFPLSGCSPFDVPQQLLRMNRARSIWSSGRKDDFELTCTLTGLSGDEAITYSPHFDELSTKQARILIFHSSHVETVRMIVDFPSPVWCNRIILLWIIRKWDHFVPSLFHLCGTLLSSQNHIVAHCWCLYSFCFRHFAYFACFFCYPLSILVGHICDAMRAVWGLSPNWMTRFFILIDYLSA